MTNTTHTPEPTDHTSTPQPGEPSAATETHVSPAAAPGADTPTAAAPLTDVPPMETEAGSPAQRRAQPVKWLTPLWASLTAAGIAVVAFGLGAGTATAVTHLTDLDRGVSMVSDGRGPGASSLDENGRGPGGPGGFGSAESRDFGSRGMPGSQARRRARARSAAKVCRAALARVRRPLTPEATQGAARNANRAPILIATVEVATVPSTAKR